MNAMSRPNGAQQSANVVTVSLNLQEWNNVLGCVAKQPWEVADPLMQAIRQQIMAAVQGGLARASAPEPPPPDTAGPSAIR